MDKGVRNRALIAIGIVVGIIAISLLILFVVLFLGSLFISSLTKEPRTYMHENAEKNAMNYVYDKYGMKPKIVSTKIFHRTASSFSPSKTNECIVKMKYNNKEFEVLIPCDKESIDGYDDYEYDYILEKYRQYLSNKFNISVPYISLYNQNLFEDAKTDYYKYIKPKYNNDNFSEMFKYSVITIYTNGNYDINAINDYFDSFKEDSLEEVYLYNFVDNDRYNEYRKIKDKNIDNYLNNYYINLEYRYNVYNKKSTITYDEYSELKTNFGFIKYKKVDNVVLEVEESGTDCYKIYNKLDKSCDNIAVNIYVPKNTIDIKKENLFIKARDTRYEFKLLDDRYLKVDNYLSTNVGMYNDVSLDICFIKEEK